jgi:hypothetical protein
VSDLERAVEWLERRQRQLYADTGMNPEAKLSDEADRQLTQQVIEALDLKVSPDEFRREHEAYVARSKGRPSTRLEDPSLFASIHAQADAIEAAAAALGWTLPPRPVLGTLPLGQLNALAIRVPNPEEYVLAFQRGVIGLINLLTKAVAAALPPITDARTGRASFNPHLPVVKEAFDRNDEPLRRLSDFLAAYVLTGHAHAAQPYILKGPALLLAAHLGRSGQLFVVGHEYGHIASGHFDVRRSRRRKLGRTEVDVAPTGWSNEYEADFIGMVLTTKALQEDLDLALSYAGVDLLFSAISLVDRAISTVMYGSPERGREYDSHPPPDLRREALRRRVTELPVDALAIQGAVELASRLADVLDLMWSLVQPKFARLHSSGIQPARCWLP